MTGFSNGRSAQNGTNLTAFALPVVPTAMLARSLSGFVRNTALGAVGRSLKGAKIAFALRVGRQEERRHNGNGLHSTNNWRIRNESTYQIGRIVRAVCLRHRALYGEVGRGWDPV